MIMKAGQEWHCTNPACRCEVLVQSTSEKTGGNPRCVCGAAMKRSYTPPTFTYLDFLRIDEPLAVRESSREG
jgi:hypothetical protein